MAWAFTKGAQMKFARRKKCTRRSELNPLIAQQTKLGVPHKAERHPQHPSHMFRGLNLMLFSTISPTSVRAEVGFLHNMITTANPVKSGMDLVRARIPARLALLAQW